ncbi:hypothetical protein [Ramlibacter tataouinensis]|uniref:Uncharacterized protein n=1 Tax=Ramlibacter tataouinensis (strain ATCC BAA-407 / DSM 14655 / LMG 21543 / TTB310) TaxID=365046 RepID=F5XVX5_RAMTT|nr:hypothetical protein [Ramlibacter tataouinensis]AEG94078.1 hypothetical protein Rta_29740 [Ramlibacter tataouinensis TTB310]
MNGDASVARAELARDRQTGEADAEALVFAMVDRLAGGSDDWRVPVERVLATSSNPTWRSIAHAIEKLG